MDEFNTADDDVRLDAADAVWTTAAAVPHVAFVDGVEIRPGETVVTPDGRCVVWNDVTNVISVTDMT
jgi:signal peptidase I